MTMRHLKTFVIGTGALVLLSIASGHAQNTSRTTAPVAGAQAAQAEGDARSQAMMAEMQSTQKRLDDLVAQMNAANGPEKVDRIAAVVNEMAAMHQRMSAMMMQGGMMRMMQGGRGTMPPQPPASTGPDHSEHHAP